MAKKEKLQIEVEVPSKKIHIENIFCANGHSLCDESKKIHGYPSIKLKMKFKKKEGFIYLDPLYGSFDNVEEGLEIPHGGVAEFFCPECGMSLQAVEETCQLCASPLFIGHLPKGGIIEGCQKKGCYYHRMKIIDAEQQIARLFENDTLESYL